MAMPGGGQPAVGLHNGQGDGDAHVLQALDQQAEIGLDHGADVAVDDGGAGALVLLHLWEEVGGEGLDDPWGAFAEDLGDVLLVGRIGVGVEQADGHGLDATVQHGLGGAFDGGGVEGAQDFAAEVEAFADLKAVLALHEGWRLFVVEVVKAGGTVASEFEDIAEALGGDEGHVGALFLDDGVGGHGEAVADLGDLRGVDAELVDAGTDAPEDGAAVVVGGAGDLAGEDAAVVAEEYDVGEGAADVDADTEFWHGGVL